MITAGLALVVLGAAAAYAVSTAGRLEPAALAGGANARLLRYGPAPADSASCARSRR